MVHAKLRVLNNIAGLNKLDLYLNGSKSFINVEYKGIYPYVKIRHGNYNLGVTLAGTSNFLTSRTIPKGDGRPPTFGGAGTIGLKPSSYYTLIFYGSSLENIRVILLENSRALAIRGKSQIRFFNASQNLRSVGTEGHGGLVAIGEVDVYLNNSARLFSAVEYGTIGVPEYLTLDSGVIGISLTLKDQLDVISGPFTLQLMDRNYTIVSTGGSGIIVLTDYPVESKCNSIY